MALLQKAGIPYARMETFMDKINTGESEFLPSPIRAYGRKKRTGAVLRTTGTVLLAITTRKVV